MNAERRIQRVRKAIEPIGNSKSDWEIISLVAEKMGQGALFNFHSAEEIWDEIRSVWKNAEGMTYTRLDQGGLQWPCPSEDHAGTEVLHMADSPVGKRIALRRINYRPSSEQVTDEYPIMMTTGRTLFHFNAGTMTLRTPNRELWPTDYLEIGADNAKQLGLINGDKVSGASSYGEATLNVKINESVRSGEVFASFHTPEVFLNYVTGTNQDNHTKTPEYKLTAVSIRKI